MAIITQDFENNNTEKQEIARFYKENKLGTLLTQSKITACWRSLRSLFYHS